MARATGAVTKMTSGRESFQVPFQTFPRPMDPRLDGSQWNVEATGDLIVRELLLVTQQQNDAIVLWQLVDRPANGLP